MQYRLAVEGAAARARKILPGSAQFTREAQAAKPVIRDAASALLPTLERGKPQVSTHEAKDDQEGLFRSLVIAHSGYAESPALNNIIQSVWVGRAGLGMDILVRNAIARIKSAV